MTNHVKYLQCPDKSQTEPDESEEYISTDCTVFYDCLEIGQEEPDHISDLYRGRYVMKNDKDTSEAKDDSDDIEEYGQIEYDSSQEDKTTNTEFLIDNVSPVIPTIKENDSRVCHLGTKDGGALPKHRVLIVKGNSIPDVTDTTQRTSDMAGSEPIYCDKQRVVNKPIENIGVGVNVRGREFGDKECYTQFNEKDPYHNIDERHLLDEMNETDLYQKDNEKAHYNELNERELDEEIRKINLLQEFNQKGRHDIDVPNDELTSLNGTSKNDDTNSQIVTDEIFVNSSDSFIHDDTTATSGIKSKHETSPEKTTAFSTHITKRRGWSQKVGISKSETDSDNINTNQRDCIFCVTNSEVEVDECVLTLVANVGGENTPKKSGRNSLNKGDNEEYYYEVIEEATGERFSHSTSGQLASSEVSECQNANDVEEKDSKRDPNINRNNKEGRVDAETIEAASLLASEELQDRLYGVAKKREKIRTTITLTLSWALIQLFFLVLTFIYASACVCSFKRTFSCSKKCLNRDQK